MATPVQTRLRVILHKDSDVQLRIERRLETPSLEETIAERDRMLGVVTGYSRGELTKAELPTDAHTYPGRIIDANARIDEFRSFETERESFDPATQWTLQQQATNAAGEPRFVLQKEDESGELRTVTGSREELDRVIAEHGLTPLELPAVTEVTYHRQAIGSVELSPEIHREESLGVGV